MKKLYLLAAFALLAPFVLLYSPLMAATGRGYFEDPNNFDAYNAGNGKIHIKVFVFGEGDNNYNAGRGENHDWGNLPAPYAKETGSRIYTQSSVTAASMMPKDNWLIIDD